MQAVSWHVTNVIQKLLEGLVVFYEVGRGIVPFNGGRTEAMHNMTALKNTTSGTRRCLQGGNEVNKMRGPAQLSSGGTPAARADGGGCCA